MKKFGRKTATEVYEKIEKVLEGIRNMPEAYPEYKNHIENPGLPFASHSACKFYWLFRLQYRAAFSYCSGVKIWWK